MTDDQQLSSDLRSLESDEDPNPAFADELFARLQVEAVTARGRGATWVLLAAAALIATLAVGAALGSGIVKLPALIAEATPSASPSGTLQASASATAAESASAEPTVSATPEPSSTLLPGGNLAVDGVATVLVDSLSLRAEPGLDGERLGTLAAGYAGFIAGGPIVADGYTWYQLSAFGLPPNSGCAGPVETDPFNCPGWFGWAAAGDLDGTPWLEGASLVCPESPMNMVTLALARGPYERLACSLNRSITVRGWWPELPPDGLGGACVGADHPSGWLFCQNINYDSIVIDEGEGFGGVGLPINLAPEGGVTMPARGQWVEVEAHFDDPAAEGCDEAASLGEEVVNRDQVVLACRAQLVVDAVRPVSGPF